MATELNNRREDILLAAAQIISQKGFHAASMQDIADAVCLQKASLYHHVSSKQEILLALLDQALDLLIEQMQEVLDRPVQADEKLHAAMQTYLLTLLEHRDLAVVLLLEHRSLEPEYRSRHIPRRDRLESMWRQVIQEGLDSQAFNYQDPAFTARSVLGALNWTITWYRPDGSLTPQEISDRLVNLFLAGLLMRPVSPAHRQD